MKIAVVGPGALGCLLAGLLKSRTREEIWLVDRSPERARRLRKDGIRIEGLSGPISVPVNACANPKEIGPCDLVVVCVKSYSTEEACKNIRRLVSDDTCILTLQNGVGNVQTLTKFFGAERVIGGITNQGATLLGTGHVRHAGKGETLIGSAKGALSGKVRKIADILTSCGFDTKISRDIDSAIWSKLIINAGINALTAITKMKNGMLIENSTTREVLRKAVLEAAGIVRRRRVKLLYDDPVQKTESVCRATALNISSMLQDVMKSRRTEIDYINGAITKHGRIFGIPTPVNEMLTDLVKTTEASYGSRKA